MRQDIEDIISTLICECTHTHAHLIQKLIASLKQWHSDIPVINRNDKLLSQIINPLEIQDSNLSFIVNLCDGCWLLTVLTAADISCLRFCHSAHSALLLMFVPSVEESHYFCFKNTCRNASHSLYLFDFHTLILLSLTEQMYVCYVK